MCKRGRLFSSPCCKPGCVCWKSWMRPVLLSFVAVWLLMVPGCCSTSSTPVPTLPVLPSLQRATLDGTPGVWMDSDDAGRLAIWIHDVTGKGDFRE